ncbi:MAG TPA: hypothetical protein DDW89_00790 [Gammaproteobacteria bacterium]|nr:hypothetical protein [Gammaproteobacteria bacterium]
MPEDTVPTDNEAFARHAQALYGVSAWPAAFATDSGLSVRQVHRIKAGQVAPSRRAWQALHDVAYKRLFAVGDATLAVRERIIQDGGGNGG